MAPTQELVDSIYREKVLRARGMSPGQRLDAGIELFEMSLNWMRTGIKHQFPDASEEEVEKHIQKRLKIGRRLDEHGIYKPVLSIPA